MTFNDFLYRAITSMAVVIDTMVAWALPGGAALPVGVFTATMAINFHKFGYGFV